MSFEKCEQGRAPTAPLAFALAFAFALTLSTGLGCAGPSKASRAAGGESAAATGSNARPDWLSDGCRSYWSDPQERREVVCGVGSAASNRNRVAARETAIARARSDIARSLQVTIESLVKLDDRSGRAGELETIVHQLSSASLRGVQLEEVWRGRNGEVHALVSLDVGRIQESVRSNRSLSPAARESLAERAAAAFAELDAAFDESPRASDPPSP